MTTEQIKDAIFRECESKTARIVATELGTSEEALRGFLIKGSPMETHVLQKAVEFYVRGSSPTQLPHEVLMGKPEVVENHEEVSSGIPDPFNGGPGEALPVVAQLAGARQISTDAFDPEEQNVRVVPASNAPPLAPPIKTGALARVADPIPEPPVDNVKESARRPVKKAVKATGTPQKNLCLLFPIYKSVDPATFMTILAFWDKSTMGAEMSPGDAMIARSRNRLAKRFLEGDCEWSLWLDDDVVFPCGSAGLFRYLTGGVDPFAKKQVNGHWSNDIPDSFLNYSTPSRLISHGKSLVAGSYYDRWGKDTITAVYSTGPQNRIPADSLHPVDFAGTGCMLVHRKVYEDIATKFPGMWPEKGECQFFTPIEGKDRMHGEDQSFCWRAKEAGHPTYLDLGLICGHMGQICYGLPKK